MSWNRLVEYISDLNRPVAIAFSGGVDSSLVAAAARHGGNAVAFTIKSDFITVANMKRSELIAREVGIRHEIGCLDVIHNSDVVSNKADRCYYCKGLVFAKIREMTGDQVVIMDGTNEDDDPHRPGMKAAREAGVLSPLRELGITKSQVRAMAKAVGLSNWNAPSDSCLATRVRTGQKLDLSTLELIEAVEALHLEKGVSTLRARVDNLMITIEYPSNDKAIVDDCEESALELIRRHGFEGPQYLQWD